MDSERRRQLIEAIEQPGLRGARQPLPVVSLEEFFIGNNDEGSIGCNLLDHPGIPAFFDLLREIRSRPEVQDVLVEVYEVDDQDESMWPFSERAYILTSASKQEVESWVAPLAPDDVGGGYAFGEPAAAPVLKLGMRVVSVWWD